MTVDAPTTRYRQLDPRSVYEAGIRGWTLFSPNDVPDLHDLYGTAFEERYEQYEQMARDGELKLHKTLKAQNLWRKMLHDL